MAENNFVPPEWLTKESADVIHGRMLEQIPDDIDKTQGGFVWDMTRPTALELAQMKQFTLPQMLKCISPVYSDGIWLDLHAQNRGITRHPAVKATGDLKIEVDFSTSKSNTITVPKGTRVMAQPAMGQPGIVFETDEEVEFALNETSPDKIQNKTVDITAIEAGAGGNVGKGEIAALLTPIEGVVQVSNEDATSGGIDAEKDESLRSRINDYDKSQGVSFIGSPSDYRRWALETVVDGLQVGTVKVIPAKDEPGLVTLVITDKYGQEQSFKLINAVYKHIMGVEIREDGTEVTDSADSPLRLAPVGARLKIKYPSPLYISIMANLEIDNVTNTNESKDEVLRNIRQSFAKALSLYWIEAAEAAKIKYAEVGALLLRMNGVRNYQDLRVYASNLAAGSLTEDNLLTNTYLLKVPANNLKNNTEYALNFVDMPNATELSMPNVPDMYGNKVSGYASFLADGNSLPLPSDWNEQDYAMNCTFDNGFIPAGEGLYQWSNLSLYSSNITRVQNPTSSLQTDKVAKFVATSFQTYPRLETLVQFKQGESMVIGGEVYLQNGARFLLEICYSGNDRNTLLQFRGDGPVKFCDEYFGTCEHNKWIKFAVCITPNEKGKNSEVTLLMCGGVNDSGIPLFVKRAWTNLDKAKYHLGQGDKLYFNAGLDTQSTASLCLNNVQIYKPSDTRFRVLEASKVPGSDEIGLKVQFNQMIDPATLYGNGRIWTDGRKDIPIAEDELPLTKGVDFIAD